jgi:hypothetical protein
MYYARSGMFRGLALADRHFHKLEDVSFNFCAAQVSFAIHV